MDRKDRRLIAEADGVRLRLWRALLTRLSPEGQQLLYLYEMLSLERLMLAGELELGPMFCHDEARGDLRENVQIGQMLLRLQEGEVARA